MPADPAKWPYCGGVRCSYKAVWHGSSCVEENKMTEGSYARILGCVAALALVAGCGQSGSAEKAADTTTTVTAEAPVDVAPAADAPVAAGNTTPAVASENFADFTGVATNGKTVFLQCMACHSLKEGENKVGPSLYSKIGKTAGQVPGFNYSDANKNSGIVWTEAELFTYLKNPRAAIPGTKMVFAGIPDPQKRADLIAYLKVNGAV